MTSLKSGQRIGQIWSTKMHLSLSLEHAANMLDSPTTQVPRRLIGKLWASPSYSVRITIDRLVRTMESVSTMQTFVEYKRKHFVR